MAKRLFILFIAGLFAVIGCIKNPKPIKNDKIVTNKQQTEEYQSKFISRHLNLTLQELFSRFINEFNSFINLFESNNTMPDGDFRFNGLDVSKILNATITSTTSDLLNNSDIWWVVSKKKCNEKNRSYTDVRDLFLAASIKAGNDIKNQFVIEAPDEFVKLSPDQRAERKMILFKASWKYFSKLDITPLAENLTQLFTNLKNNSKTNCQNLDELTDLLKNRYLIPSSRFILDEYNLRKTEIPETENYKLDVATEFPDSVTTKMDVATEFPDSVTTKLDVATDFPDSVTTKLDMTTDLPDSVTTKLDVTTDFPDSVTTKLDVAADVPDTVPPNADMGVDVPHSVPPKVDVATDFSATVTTKVDVATDVPASERTKVDVSTDVPIFLTTQTNVSTDVPVPASTVVDVTANVPISATTEVDIDPDVPLSPTAEVDMTTDVPLSGSGQVDTSAEIPATEDTPVLQDINKNMSMETPHHEISQENKNPDSAKTENDNIFQMANVSMIPKTIASKNIQMETSIRTNVSGSKLEDSESTITPLSLNTKGNGFEETPVMRSQVNLV